jgi:hypothetical protein
MSAAEPSAEALAGALGGQRNGRGWLALCPAHKDHDPSLSIEEHGGRTVFKCRANCEQKNVLAELRKLGVWPEAEPPPPPRQRDPVAIYPYRDETGALRYQVCRWPPKGDQKLFSQRRPNGDGGWIAGKGCMRGVELLPYRLPELLGDPMATVFIVEGEKDVDNLAEIGIVASCNTGGAGKWQPEIGCWLDGRDVVIIPDNDPPGRAHAQDVAAKLSGIAASIRILELPGLGPKEDVSNWLARGGTADDLDRLAAEIGPAEPTGLLGEWDAGDDDGPIPPRGWLLGNTFCRRFLSSLIGDGGVGKTALRIVQALSLVTKRSLTGEHVFQRGRVLYLSFEDDRDELRRRVRAACLHHKIEPAELQGWLYLAAVNGLKLLEQTNGEIQPGTLAETLRATIINRQIDLVILDPFIKTHRLDENNNAAVDQVATLLAEIAIEHNCAVDTPHHVNKGLGAQTPGDANRSRGASAFKDAGRLVYTLTPMAKEDRELLGVDPTEAKTLIRVDSGKVNIARPATEAHWFRLVGVPIGNETDDYPSGDEVQTVEPWDPPDLWGNLPITIINAILDQLERGGPKPGQRYSVTQQAKGDRAAWSVILDHCHALSEKQARIVIATWLKNGMIESRDYFDPVERKTRAGAFVLRRPG